MGYLKYNKTLLFAFITVSCLLVVSCAEEIQNEKVGLRVPVNLDAMGEPAINRATINLQGDVFKKDQLINTYFTVTANNSASSLISLKDGTLNSVGNPIVLKTTEASNGVNGLSPNDGSTLYFPPGDNDKVNASIYALYPSTVTNIMTNFAVQTTQTSDDLYMLSDLMHASTSTAKTDQTIHLQFTHKMAKLVINAVGEENLTMNKITLKSLYTTIGWTPTTGELGSLSGDKTDIVIADQENFTGTLSGVALFPPQEKGDTYFMEVVCQDPADNNNVKTAYFNICTKNFEEGKVYIINVKIGPRNLKDDGVILIEPWPSTVGVINIEAVGNMGLDITSLADDGVTTTNTMSGSGLSGYYTYNGKVCTPIPTVTDGKDKNPTTLVAGTDYEVKYYNNLNAGTALVVVTGKGDYEGFSTFKTFTINRAANTMSYPNNNAAFSTNLSKNAIVQNALVKPSLQTNEVYGHMTYGLYSDAACTNAYTGDIATIDANGNVNMQKKGGPIYVKASMDDTGNYEAKSVSYKLTITAGDISQTITIEWNDGAAVGSETWPFTGLAVRPGFKIKDNGNTLAGSENSGGYDYNYTYGNNIQVGSGSSGPYVEITGQGEYTGTKRFYFSITKVDNSWVALNEPSVPIDCGATGSSPQGSDMTLPLSLPPGTFEIGGRPQFGTGTNYTGTTGNVTYTSQDPSICTVSSTGVITGVAPGTTTVTATVGETANYNSLTKSINVTVEKMSYIFVYNGSTEQISTNANTYFQVNGSAQSFDVTLTANATVYAAVVGAGGGSDQSGAARGGQGGLVVAKHTYTKNTRLQWFIFCGGGGQSCIGGTDDSSIQSLGGWPGGARPGTSGSSGAGGGATAICTTNSTNNWDYSANDSRMLVAGGGGGSSYSITQGGYAGGPKGTSAGDMSDYSGNVKQKWMGGRAAINAEVYVAETDVTTDGGSGGAGYYGGRGGAEVSSSNDVSQGGHGGSNFIKSDWITIYNGYSGTENGSGTSSTYSPNTQEPFTIQYNGHKRSDNISDKSAYRMWPGYVLIKITY